MTKKKPMTEQEFIRRNNIKADYANEKIRKAARSAMEAFIEDDSDHKRRSGRAYMLLLNCQEKFEISDARMKKIGSCSQFKSYAMNEQRDARVLLFSQTCKDRFCSICAGAKAVRDTMKTLAVANAMVKMQGYRALFVTLTMPNTPTVAGGLDELAKGFKRLMEYARVESVVRGYIAKVETTYNKHRNDYHCHMHVLMFVPKSYFNKRKKSIEFIEADEWLALWQRAMDDETITQIDVQVVKNRGKTGTMLDISLEMGKYVAKDEDYTQSQEVYEEFRSGLKGRQLLRFGGECAEFSRAYDEDKYGLFRLFFADKVEERKIEDFVTKMGFTWHKSEGYKVEDQGALTDKDKDQLRRRFFKKASSELEADLKVAEAFADKVDDVGVQTKRRRNYKVTGLKKLIIIRNWLEKHLKPEKPTD